MRSGEVLKMFQRRNQQVTLTKYAEGHWNTEQLLLQIAVMKLHLFLLLVFTVVPVVQTVYRRFYLILQTKTWANAQAYCRAMYTDLATIEHQYEVDQLQHLDVINAVPSSVSMWIGLYNDVNSWRWSMADEPLGTYNKWFFGNPDNHLAGDCCGLMNMFFWFDGMCTELLPFICFDGRYSGTSSYIYNSNAMTWFGAQSYCRQHHTDLVSVRNNAEYTDLMMIITGNTWIGLYRDSWKWSDGTSFTNITWASGEPNNALLNENCVVFKQRKSGDVMCSRLKPFFCEAIITGKKQIVKIKVLSSQDVNDPAVKAAILDQMKTILSNHGNITVKWREQANGRMFDKI